MDIDLITAWGTNVAVGVGIAFAISLGLTVTVLLEHYVLTWLAAKGIFKTVGEVENPDVTAHDLFWFVINTWITWMSTCTHVYSVYKNRHNYINNGLLTLPSLGQLFVVSVTTLFMHDMWHYSIHRWAHTTTLAWVKKLHGEHHLRVVHSKGMLCTDLMAVHPLEYWITIMPAYSLCFEIFHLLPNANFIAWVLSSWSAVLIAELGHSNIDIPFPLIKYFGFSSVSDHSMHHHDSRYNFAIYTTVLDRLFGSYKPYTTALSRAGSRRSSKNVSRQSSFRQLKSKQTIKDMDWDQLLSGLPTNKDGAQAGETIKAAADPSHAKAE